MQEIYKLGKEIHHQEFYDIQNKQAWPEAIYQDVTDFIILTNLTKQLKLSRKL